MLNLQIVSEWEAVYQKDFTNFLSYVILFFFLVGPLDLYGEGNGNALQCSCLENPRDGRTWWAAVYVGCRTESDTTETT